MQLITNSKLYDTAKWVVQIVLPAVASLYFGLSAIWNLPNTEEVVGSLAVVATFLGVVLGISSNQYHNSGAAYDGSIILEKTQDGKKLYTLEFDGDPEDISGMKDVSFKVEEE